MNIELLRKELISYVENEERSLAWVARKAEINVKSLQKFASGERKGMCEENLSKLRTFLKE